MKDRSRQEQGPQTRYPDPAPIEPQGARSAWAGYFKWVFLGLILVYLLLSHYHAPVLTWAGRYLVVEDTPSESDLIVCMAGGNVERGLATAELYGRGLAPRIFVAREEPPDGLELARSKGVKYPETIDLMVMLLEALGVPRSAILLGEKPSNSTLEEARIVRELVKRQGYSSLILITSPTHTRRVLLSFRKVFEGEEVRLQVVPTPYSDFRPENWWKNRKYARVVILEYQKLIYYVLKDLRG
ncbi:MAG: YdcF family protein [Thermodesulfobacteriota bacterium]